MSEPPERPENVPPVAAAEPQPPAPPNARPLRLLHADELFGDSKEVLIQNGNDMYRLRRTRSGKLILCK